MIAMVVRRLGSVATTPGRCFFTFNAYTLVYTLSISPMAYTMSIPEKRSPQFPMRLNEDFRSQLEEEMRKDGDSSLATWIKRILRKELQQRGIEPKG